MKPKRLLFHVALCISTLSLIAATKVVCAEVDLARDDPYASRKVFYELHWQNKIAAALEYVNGVIVCVDVELTPEMQRSATFKEYSPKAVAEVESHAVSRHERDDSAGPNSEGKATPGPETSEQETVHTKYLVSESQESTSVAGLIPRSVSVSVSIPRSYYAAIWQSRQQQTAADQEQKSTPPAAELRAIEEEVHDSVGSIVAALLPPKSSHRQLNRVVSFSDVRMSASQGARAINQRPSPNKITLR